MPCPSKFSVLEATKQIFVKRNDSAVSKSENHQLSTWVTTLAQIGIQFNMVGFIVGGHTL